jgi:S1-C subfamily serine protease
MFKKMFVGFCLLINLQSQSLFAQGLKSEDLYKKVLPSVMTLSITNQDGSGSLGTGFLALKDGFAVTAWHVVKNASKVSAKFSDGEVFESSGLIDKDEKRDIALIRIKVSGRPMLELQSSDPSIGSKAYVVGAPEGLEFSITDGLVSQIQSADGVKWYQYSCPTSHGNSGGPVLNDSGRVLGIVSRGLTEGNSLNFAVPSNYVLGLDQTLPTTPWVNVKPSAPTKTPSTSNNSLGKVEFDKVYFAALAAFQNADVAYQYINLEVAGKNAGYRNGVPSWLYSRMRTATEYADYLGRITSVDSSRELAKGDLIRNLQSIASAGELLSKGIVMAGKSDGWGSAASDLSKQATSYIIDIFRLGIFDRAQALVAAEPDILENCPVSLRDFVRKNGDETGFDLGAVAFTDFDDRYLVVVHKSGIAEKIGLRSGDRIVSIEGNAVADILSFKKELIRFAGSKVKIVVQRENRERSFGVKVPAKLTKP